MYEINAKWDKETVGKYRWVVMVEDAPFELYIPKWRIPEPIPEEILIKIYFPLDNLQYKKSFSREEVESSPNLKWKKIFSDIHFVEAKTKTIKYEPDGEQINWEIGSPYIPKSIFRGIEFRNLSIVVEWL